MKVYPTQMFCSLIKSSSTLPKLLAGFRPNLKIPAVLPRHVDISVETMASSVDPAKLTVFHDTKTKEFYIPLGDGKHKKAVLHYSYISPNHVDLRHTLVPPEFRRHGIAKLLAQTAFDHFVEKGMYMQPTCTYLQKFYKENPLPQYKEKIRWYR